MKTVFVNPERCIACHQCEIACAVEHSRGKDLYTAPMEMPTPRSRIHVSEGIHLNSSFPNKCRHCDPAPCMAVCPTKAIGRDADTGFVVIDGYRCITCAMCAMVCPFDVIRYYASPFVELDKAVAVKCDHCIDRQRRGEMPACAEVCKVGALVFGDVNELVKAASSRLAKAVSVAAGELRPEIPRVPANLETWRDWGESVSRLNER